MNLEPRATRVSDAKSLSKTLYKLMWTAMLTFIGGFWIIKIIIG